MRPEHDAAVAIRWPANRFYWALLDAPGWSRSGMLPEGLRCDFEGELPESPGDVHAVCTPLGDGRVLVCAARRAELAALPPATLTLQPAALPEFVDADGPDRLCGMLNLLVGPFEPRSRRRARGARHVLAAAFVVLCSTLLAVGFARRSAHWTGLADRAAAARTELVQTLVPAAGTNPEALLAEVARLRQSHEKAQRVRPAADAALALAELLKAWPTDVAASPQSISASGTQASISVDVESDPAPFLKAMSTPVGWTRSEPRLNTSGGATRIALTFGTSDPKEGTRR